MNRLELIAEAIRALLNDGLPRRYADIAIGLRASLGQVWQSEVRRAMSDHLRGQVECDHRIRWRLRAPGTVNEKSTTQHLPSTPIAREELLRAIHRLRFGLPPLSGLRELTVGLPPVEAAVHEFLCDDDERWMWVRGNYGEGKSHTLALARELALSRGFAVCHLSADSALAALSHPQRFVHVLLQSLELPRSDIAGFGQLLDHQLRTTQGVLSVREVARRHLSRSRQIDLATHATLARLLGYACDESADPAEVEPVLEVAELHLTGASIRDRAGPAAREVAWSVFQMSVEIIRSTGATGLVVLLDEVESIYTKMVNGAARRNARRALAALCAGPTIRDVRVLLAVTPDAMRFLEADVPDMKRDVEALDNEPVWEWGTRLHFERRIDCIQLSATSRTELVDRVRSVYEDAYGALGEFGSWNQLVARLRMGGETLSTRLLVRAAVNLLDLESCGIDAGDERH